MVFYMTCTKYRSVIYQISHLRQAVHLLQRPPQMRWRRPRNCWETPGLRRSRKRPLVVSVKPCGDGTYPKNHEIMGKNAGEDS